ncbi:cysteine methyltransferase [Bifidobacterium anseris]|uniref:Methylated-DNA--protein-cysteine methyltransferase n=1 Tax=Bifidobacterium anseris TaxID=2020963 RepID=A0A2N5IXH5_9BIFI|nr:methylated-DNA--[protein]-cysteine S-methyltransferase [Bifidobacterium anseris]PLS26661.1 cysteine methyltransferase [Bifidobacterium anseris]
MQGFATYMGTYGPVRIDWQDDAVTGLHIVTRDDHELDGDGARTELTDRTFDELERYFAGALREFTVPVAFTFGTPFQHAVWHALQQIPYGQTRTYAQIAQAVGRPKAVRAVGSANNRNPIPFIVPCHRVIGANGNLVGYAYGVEMKRSLLLMEMRAIEAE